MNRCLYILISAFFWAFSIWNVYALEKIAIIDISSVFHQSSQRMEVVKQLENEFKDRAVELQSMEHELQMKMQTLQRDGSTMKAEERNALEQSVVDQREIFSNKAKIFQQDNQTRQTEERDKILNIIHSIVNNIAKKEGYDLVIDSNAVIYNTKNIKDITKNVMNQVK